MIRHCPQEEVGSRSSYNNNTLSLTSLSSFCQAEATRNLPTGTFSEILRISQDMFGLRLFLLPHLLLSTHISVFPPFILISPPPPLLFLCTYKPRLRHYTPVHHRIISPFLITRLFPGLQQARQARKKKKKTGKIRKKGEEKGKDNPLSTIFISRPSRSSRPRFLYTSCHNTYTHLITIHLHRSCHITLTHSLPVPSTKHHHPSAFSFRCTQQDRNRIKIN